MMKRILISAMLCAVLLLGGSGCMNIFPQSDESIRDEILEHLNRKYDKEFTALSLDRGHTDLLLCHVQGTDPESDLVHAQRVSKDNSVDYKDTYFGIIIRDEIESEIKSLCSDLNLPLQVFYPSHDFYYDNIFDNSKSYADLKQWIEKGNSWRFDVTIVLSLDDISEGETIANQVFEKLYATNSQLFVYLCVLPSEGFTNVSRTNLNDIIRQYDGQTAIFTKNIN